VFTEVPAVPEAVLEAVSCGCVPWQLLFMQSQVWLHRVGMSCLSVQETTQIWLKQQLAVGTAVLPSLSEGEVW